MPDSQPVLVLLVEDDADYAATVAAVLHASAAPRFEAVVCSTLACALKDLTSRSVDCVLADLGLPDSGGMDTVRAIREAAPHVPIVVLSGLVDEQIRREALGSGAVDAVDKAQLSSAFLVHVLVTALEREKQRLLELAKAGIERLDRLIQRLRAQAQNGVKT